MSFSGGSISPKVATTIGFGGLLVGVFLAFGMVKVKVLIVYHAKGRVTNTIAMHQNFMDMESVI